MAKYMRMEHLLHWNKTVDSAKLDLTRNGFMSMKSSIRKEMMMKGANYISKKSRFKIMAEKSNKSLIISITNEKPFPASIGFLGFLVQFLECAVIEGLNFSGFIVVIALVFAAASFLGLIEYFKTWRWLRMHQLKARKSVKQEPGNETRTAALSKWAWIEDLVYGMDVSGIDDLFITTCILVGLGFLCGFLVLYRRLYSKNLN